MNLTEAVKEVFINNPNVRFNELAIMAKLGIQRNIRKELMALENGGFLKVDKLTILTLYSLAARIADRVSEVRT